MQAYDDDEFEGSQNGASDDEQDANDDEMEQDENEEGEGEGEADEGADDDEEEDGDADVDGDGEDEDENEEGGSQTAETPKRSVPTAPPAPTSLGVTPVLAPPEGSVGLDGARETDEKLQTPLFPPVRPEALIAADYDIVPTIAAPQSTSINVVTSTPDMRWVFTGGTDGYIRKFNWIDTANNRIALTVAQRQHLVDTISKAGVLTSYWENEDPLSKSINQENNLSPVYALAVHSRALWLLSGCESGAINLQTVRHEEGKTQHRLKQHTSAVSVLTLAQDEKSVLSGSWDKVVIDWDLNTGSAKRRFLGSTGQISSMEMRPFSSLPVPEIEDLPVQSTTMFSDSAAKQRTNGDEVNGKLFDSSATSNGEENGVTSPADSLFGGQDNDSLFGGGDDNNGEQLFGDGDELSRAIASGISAQNETDGTGEIGSIDAEDKDGTTMNGTTPPTTGEGFKMESTTNPISSETNGLPHAEDVEMRDADAELPVANGVLYQPLADSVFMTSSIDGSIRIWDRRRQEAVAKIIPKNTPPWCMGACWSPDGNYIFAGRRNGTVEEFSLHKGLRAAERTFRFPPGSGPVSAVRALPNGRHLICASYDTLRLYDLKQQQMTSKPPFLVVSGHRTGIISQLYVDPSCRFMISTAGNRGWEGVSTQLMLGYEINILP